MKRNQTRRLPKSNSACVTVRRATHGDLYDLFIGDDLRKMWTARQFRAEGKLEDAVAIEEGFRSSTLDYESQLAENEREGNEEIAGLLRIVVRARREIWDDFCNSEAQKSE